MVKNRPAPSHAHGATALLPALRARIARHELPPGTKLLENELSREFGVSRAKVRDAFGALAQRGLIQRIPNRGAVVARLDLSQVFEIYDVREMLEGLCVRLAVKPALLKKTLARTLNMLSHRVRFGYPLIGVVIGG